MFPNRNRAALYAKALKQLQDPAVLDREVWLHDYDEPVYRTGPNHSRNGLHWGYPDGILSSLLGVDIGGSGSSRTYAFFVDDPQMKGARPNENSRFKKARYREIHESISTSLHQKLAEATAASVQEEEIREQWREAVSTNFPMYANFALRLELAGRNIRVIVIDPDRSTTRGFGCYFEGLKEGDVSISPAALRLLERIPSRSGLQGLYVFKGPILAGVLNLDSALAPEDLSVEPEGLAALRAIATITE